jgi:hypothetical protein
LIYTTGFQCLRFTNTIAEFICAAHWNDGLGDYSISVSPVSALEDSLRTGAQDLVSNRDSQLDEANYQVRESG